MALFHLALTKLPRSVQASAGVPKSVESNVPLPGISGAGVVAGALLATGAVGAAAGALAALESCLPQALRVKARLMPRARGLNNCLDMEYLYGMRGRSGPQKKFDSQMAA